MKLDELIREINKYDFLYAQVDSKLWPGNIVISIKNANQYLPFIVMPKDERDTNDYDFYPENLLNNIGPMTLRNVLNMVTAYVSTPVKERFSEKKYRLVANPYSLKHYFEKAGTYGIDCATDYAIKYATKYVAQIKDSMTSFSFVYGKPTIFSEKELRDIEKGYPNIAPAIERMKEIVKDDETGGDQ